MLRKVLVALVSIVITGGMLVGIGGGSAWATPVTITGVTTANVSCSTFIGGGKLSPKLTVAGSNGGVKINFKGKASTCSGPSDTFTVAHTAYTIVGAKVKGSGYFTTTSGHPKGSECSNFETGSPNDLVGTIRMTVDWKTAPALAVTPSVVTYTTGPYSDPVAATSMNLELGATPLTPYTITGSFPVSTVQNTVMDIPTVVTNCPVGKPFVFGPPSSSLAF